MARPTIPVCVWCLADQMHPLLKGQLSLETPPQPQGLYCQNFDPSHFVHPSAPPQRSALLGAPQAVQSPRNWLQYFSQAGSTPTWAPWNPPRARCVTPPGDGYRDFNSCLRPPTGDQSWTLSCCCSPVSLDVNGLPLHAAQKKLKGFPPQFTPTSRSP